MLLDALAQGIEDGINRPHALSPLRDPLAQELNGDLGLSPGVFLRGDLKVLHVGRFALKLIGKDKRFGYYFGLLLGLMFSRLKLDRLVDLFRSWVPKKGLEECISNIMQTRFVGLEVPFPGAALDVDNAKDYETLKLRFQDWRNTLRRLETQHPLPHGKARPLLRKKPAPKASAKRPLSEVDRSATG